MSDLHKKLADRRDDIDNLELIVHPFVKASESQREFENVGAIVRFCDGSPQLLSVEDAESLLNSRAFRNLDIPIRIRKHID